MKLRYGVVGLAAALLISVPIHFAAAESRSNKSQYEGTQRVTRMDGKLYVGTVEVDGDKYLIHPEDFPEMTITLRKHEILKIEKAPEKRRSNESSTTRLGPRDDDGDLLLSDDEIAALLRGIEVDESFLEDVGDPEAALPVNTDSVAEMLRVAGAGADANTLETDHFVFVYTSSPKLARDLAARLESVYRWNVKVLKQCGIQYQQPDYKLEVFFYGQHEEYLRYMNTIGMQGSAGILGFYRGDTNQSAFFDMSTWSVMEARVARANDPNVPFRERQRIRNENRRWFAWKNEEVVQHEAAHHIHFNIGVFPREIRASAGRAVLPRWTSEGLATMFELPASSGEGAALGGVNHQRLAEYREFFVNGDRLPDMRDFLLDDSIFLNGGGTFYPLGWAVTHYLWTKKRAGYAKYLQAIYENTVAERYSRTDRQKLIEDTLGKIDDEWIEDFVEYMKSLTLKRSILPPDIR